MPSWTAWIAWAVLIVGFLGTATVYLRGSKDKGTIATLQQNNDALDDRVKILEDSETRLKAEVAAAEVKHQAEIAAFNVRVKAVEDDNAFLRSQRPSAELIAEISNRLATHDATTKQLGEQIMAKLDTLPGAAP